jgi:beta-phosphoglucomutase-like phosphatase (HAD superfamily)
MTSGAFVNSNASFLKAVIFDLDGLLVDSEPLQFRAYREAFSSYGLPFTVSDWQKWHALGASASIWIASMGWDLDAEIIRAEKKLRYDRFVESDLTLKPGARSLIEDLASNGIRLCVASGSRIESIQACLARFALLSHFEALFSATKTARRKPYPDVFNLCRPASLVSATADL